MGAEESEWGRGGSWHTRHATATSANGARTHAMGSADVTLLLWMNNIKGTFIQRLQANNVSLSSTFVSIIFTLL